jgi:hypothetical protein
VTVGSGEVVTLHEVRAIDSRSGRVVFAATSQAGVERFVVAPYLRRSSRARCQSAGPRDGCSTAVDSASAP